MSAPRSGGLDADLARLQTALTQLASAIAAGARLVQMVERLAQTRTGVDAQRSPWPPGRRGRRGRR